MKFLPGDLCKIFMRGSDWPHVGMWTKDPSRDPRRNTYFRSTIAIPALCFIIDVPKAYEPQYICVVCDDRVGWIDASWLEKVE